MNDFTFTVDLGATTSTLFADDDAGKVQQIVDQHIKPGQEYTLIDMDGDTVGWIGSERPAINLDEILTTESGAGDPSDCESVEELDDLVARSKAVLRILDLATQNREDAEWGVNAYQAMRDNINTMLTDAPEVRRDLLIEAAETAEAEAVVATQCTGYLDKSVGKIAHRGACPIHG